MTLRHRTYVVSIHAPTRGATLSVRPLKGNRAWFQSTHPHGVRRDCAALYRPGVMVSIHAPTRGATMTIFTKTINRYVSIHAPTRGATTSTLLKMVKYMFQSTHPHGVRHNLGSFLEKIKSFNPRTHTGCDLFS